MTLLCRLSCCLPAVQSVHLYAAGLMPLEVLHLSCPFSLLCLQSPSNSVTPQAPQTLDTDLLYRRINIEVFPFVAPSYTTSLILKFLTSCALSCWRSCSLS